MIKLITFGDCGDNFKLASSRLLDQSLAFPQINLRKSYSKSDLGSKYESLYSDEVRHEKKGCGLWSWKPFIIKNELSSLKDNDILFYLDAGCELNGSDPEKLNHYLDFVSRNHVLAFPMKHLNIQYTKYDPCLIKEDNTFFRTQVGANVLFFLNSKKTRSFVNSWLKLSSHNGGSLLLESNSDSLKKKHNPSILIGHRHDQSTFNRVYFDYGFTPYPIDETYNQKSYKLRDYPILSFRNRTGKSKINFLLGKGPFYFLAVRIYFLLAPYFISLVNRILRKKV